MNFLDGNTSFKLLTLYMGKYGILQFHDVSNFKVVKAKVEDDFTVNGRYMSFDYVSQTTGKKTHGVFDLILFGASYEV